MRPQSAAASRSWLRPGPFALTLPALLLLTLLFMLPLLRLFSLSFAGGGFGWYEKALTGGLYTAVLYRTFEIAGIVTFFSLLIGYPVAFLLATTTPKWRADRICLRDAAAVDQRAGAHLCLDGAARTQRHRQPDADRFRPARHAAFAAQQPARRHPRHGARHAAVHDPADLQRADAHRSGSAEGGARPRCVRCCAS